MILGYLSLLVQDCHQKLWVDCWHELLVWGEPTQRSRWVVRLGLN